MDQGIVRGGAHTEQTRSIWFIWSIWFISFFWFVWFRNQMNQINQKAQRNELESLGHDLPPETPHILAA
jgi:hypothetical protein